MRIRWLTFYLLTTALVVAVGVNFPTKQSCDSPDSRWSVKCVTETEGGSFLHKLFLIRHGETLKKFVYASGRNCDVLWCGDSQRFAITDWLGSNCSDVFIATVTEPGTPVSLRVRGLDKIIQKAELQGHCYREAMRWEDSKRLNIRIFGHTDENPSHGFTYYLLVDVSTGTAKLLKKENKEPNN